jgi:hypothetical protein
MVALTADRLSSPEGKLATVAILTPLPASSRFASLTKRGHKHTAATFRGARAAVQSASAPSSVAASPRSVRSRQASARAAS